jgi:adenine-specific DNA-methyltransferase
MSREILQDIISDFLLDKFILFFRKKNRSFAPRTEDLSQYNDDNFRNGIKLGEIKFAQDEKMLICAFEVTQPLSERSGKKAQYKQGKRILKDTNSDAGIFIFYEKGNFRFSLIYPEYVGTKRQWSYFKRFTYFVSPKLTNKTFLQQIGDGDFSSLEKIKDAFSVEKVTKAFYTDIANWYFWAVKNTEFPKDAEKEESGRNITVIRMITRLIFIWFMKERGLIRQNLFNYKNISTLLKDLSPKNTTYYKAILQNLFFATLNTKIKDRKFRFGKSFQGRNKDYMDHGIYRYEEYFKNKEDMLEIFKDIPFLNGGLFDCLDRPITENNKNIEVRIDGFTDKEVGLKVPNFLFFSDEISVDLNKDYGTKNKKYKVRGLVDILSSGVYCQYWTESL